MRTTSPDGISPSRGQVEPLTLSRSRLVLRERSAYPLLPLGPHKASGFLVERHAIGGSQRPQTIPCAPCHPHRSRILHTHEYAGTGAAGQRH